MSQLQLLTNSGQFSLNVTAFKSPIYQQIQSAQTKTMEVHFPIKMVQPSIEFQVIFASEEEWETFQRAVRNHQQQAVSKATLVTMNWPERSINNWTGYIRRIEAGGQRFNFAPETTVSIDLVDSYVSQRQDYGSIAANWTAIFGLGIPGLSVLQPPSAAENQDLISNFGVNVFNNGNPGFSTTPVNTPVGVAGAPTVSNIPTAPTTLTNPGIITGSG